MSAPRHVGLPARCGDRPRPADRQPFHRDGVPRVTTGSRRCGGTSVVSRLAGPEGGTGGNAQERPDETAAHRFAAGLQRVPVRPLRAGAQAQSLRSAAAAQQAAGASSFPWRVMPKTVSRASNTGTSGTCATSAPTTSTHAATVGTCAPTAVTSGVHASTSRVPGPVVSGPSTRPAGAGPSVSPRPHGIRSRIGVGAAGGFYPAPHRYQLYLSQGCPRSLHLSITLDLLGLKDSVATTILAHPA